MGVQHLDYNTPATACYDLDEPDLVTTAPSIGRALLRRRRRIYHRYALLWRTFTLSSRTRVLSARLGWRVALFITITPFPGIAPLSPAEKYALATMMQHSTHQYGLTASNYERRAVSLGPRRIDPLGRTYYVDHNTRTTAYHGRQRAEQ
ncbi:hypothetical protein EXIGLDRAFT_762337 [Exidia glandulosa HHB12029]|uniref:WW domain-containing protein n=1 Tax=Exidia glandulosa HHB12029 TaxID=1314781 RepID=A0A165MRW8_EXIGL|nr:hypothetical protein EXIGLDRAFT_762337 [Exidia glandulosa HHB12029]